MWFGNSIFSQNADVRLQIALRTMIDNKRIGFGNSNCLVIGLKQITKEVKSRSYNVFQASMQKRRNYAEKGGKFSAWHASGEKKIQSRQKGFVRITGKHLREFLNEFKDFVFGETIAPECVDDWVRFIWGFEFEMLGSWKSRFWREPTFFYEIRGCKWVLIWICSAWDASGKW